MSNEELKSKDIELLSEALIEFIADFDEKIDLAISSIADNIDDRIRKIVLEELNKKESS